MSIETHDHDCLFKEGMKLVDDALAIFMNLDSPHGKAIANSLRGAICLAEIIFEGNKK